MDFAYGVADRTYAALGKVDAEAEQRLLNQEISHRLKNTLALVQAVAGQTLRGISDREPVQAFERRLHALSTAHDVLVERSWGSAFLGTIVTSVLKAFGDEKRFQIHGPDIEVGPRTTLSLSLLLHELATNAMKYGALSVAVGHVSVTWRIEGDELTFCWRELGGPPAVEPKQRGFGSRLIAMGLLGSGDVELRYMPTGFESVMKAPLDQIQQS